MRKKKTQHVTLLWWATMFMLLPKKESFMPNKEAIYNSMQENPTPRDWIMMVLLLFHSCSYQHS